MNDTYRLYVATKLADVQTEMAVVKEAWRVHHTLPRSSWGWGSNHTTLQTRKAQLEGELQTWETIQAHLNGAEAVEALYA